MHRLIIFFIYQGVILNCADDNTLLFINANTDVLKKVLEDESCNQIDLSLNNFMKANPTKFQAICIEKGHMIILRFLILTQLK